MKKPKNDMAELIRSRFRASGLSVKRVADLSGCHYASVHGFLTGTRDPALSTANRICEVLGLKLMQQRKRK